MRRLVLYIGLFVLAAALGAVVPTIARADRVGSARVQVRDNLGRPTQVLSGDAAEVAALLEFARDPQALVPNGLTTRPAINPSETIEKGKLAENRTKHLPVKAVRIYRDKTILVQDPGIEWMLMPVGTYHKEVIQVEGSLDDAAN